MPAVSTLSVNVRLDCAAISSIVVRTAAVDASMVAVACWMASPVARSASRESWLVRSPTSATSASSRYASWAPPAVAIAWAPTMTAD